MPISISIVGPAGDAGVRADADHGGQLVRPAAGATLRGATCASQMPSAGVSGNLCRPALGRRAGLGASPRHRRSTAAVRPGRRRHRRPLGRPAGRLPDLLTFDMGGTSTDVALVQDAARGWAARPGRPPHRPRVLGGRPHRRRRRRLDRARPELTRALRVGPQSAGAVPGPGGIRQGRRRADGHRRQRGARLPADRRWPAARSPGPRRARAAVQKIADAMGLAQRRGRGRGHRRHRQREHVRALRLVSVQQGYDPRDFALIAFGGAGPLHANALGRLRLLAGDHPTVPGVLCALRRRDHRLRDEAARTVIRRFSDLPTTRCARSCAELADEAGGSWTRGRRRGPSRPRATRSTSATTARASRSRHARPDVAATTAEGRSTRSASLRREHDRLFTFCSTPSTSWWRCAAVNGPGPDVRAVAAARAAATLGRACAPGTKVYMTAAWARPPSTTARAEGRQPSRAGDRHRDGLHHTDPAGPRRPVDESGNMLIRPVDQSQEGEPWHASSRPRPRRSTRSTSTRSRSTSSRTRCATRASRWTRCCSAPPCRRAFASSTTSSR